MASWRGTQSQRLRQSPHSLLANATVIGLLCRRRLRDRRRLPWTCLHWRLDRLRWRRVALALRGRTPRKRARLNGWLACLRWQRVTLAEVRILRFAICHKLQIDLRQRPAGSTRLRRIRGNLANYFEDFPLTSDRVLAMCSRERAIPQSASTASAKSMNGLVISPDLWESVPRV